MWVGHARRVHYFTDTIYQNLKFFSIMSDKQYDSVLVGYAEDPRYNEEGELLSWNVRFKDTELKEMQWQL